SPEAWRRSSNALHAGHSGSSTSTVGVPDALSSSGTSTPYGSSIASSCPQLPTNFEKSGAVATYATTGSATKPPSCAAATAHARPPPSLGGGAAASSPGGASEPIASLAHSAAANETALEQ